MMTCFSPTSGRASRGERSIKRQPTMAAAAARIRMTKRWRADASIRRSIMRAGVSPPHVDLRVEQEGSGYRDRFAGIHSMEDLHAAAEAPAGFDIPGLEHALASLDEHLAARARFN